MPADQTAIAKTRLDGLTPQAIRYVVATADALHAGRCEVDDPHVGLRMPQVHVEFEGGRCRGYPVGPLCRIVRIQRDVVVGWIVAGIAVDGVDLDVDDRRPVERVDMVDHQVEFRRVRDLHRIPGALAVDQPVIAPDAAVVAGDCIRIEGQLASRVIDDIVDDDLRI